jgi:hypothetical protein
MTVTAVAERLDSHNTSVDVCLAQSGQCGMLHLPSGRRCPLPVHHSGCCTFVHLDARAVPGTPPAPWADTFTYETRRLGCVLGL